MATTSYQTQLESVQAAIAAIEAGAQEYTIKDRTYKAAELATLYKRETWLRNMASREANGSGGIRITGATPL